MKTLIILTVIGAAFARPGLVYVSPLSHAVVAPPAVYKSQYHSQDELGQVSYGFAHPNQVKNEVRDVFGNVAGSYSYIDDDGKQVIVQYTAGKDGFKVKSNNLPVAPGVPESSPLQTVEDTPEVQAAKKEFFENFESLPAPLEVVPLEQVQDTPAVIKAKEEFFAAYEAARKAAEEAPDDVVVEDPVVADEPVVEVEAAIEVTESPVVEEAVVVEEEPASDDVIDTTAAVEEVVAETTPATISEPEVVEEVVADEPAVEEVVVADEPAVEEVVVAEEPAEEVVEAVAAEEMIGDAVVEEVAAEEPVEVVPAEVPALVAPLPVSETPEVAAARDEFLRLYNEAAIRAAEAPDHDLDGSLSTHSGYLSKVDGSLSPYYTNTYPYGAYGLHVPAVVSHPVHPVHYALNGLPFSYTVKN